MKSPYVYFGGKSRVASLVWERLGDPAVYVEPFAGSLAVLLARPSAPRLEVVNDLDAQICNCWRAMAAEPDRLADACDWPCIESDIHARNAACRAAMPELRARLEGDPEWYDAKIAAWWLYVMAHSIGNNATAVGPWVVRDGKLVREGQGVGVKRGMPHSTGLRAAARESLHVWFRDLQHRVRNVKVCCGDWSRVLADCILNAGGTASVFLDPPYCSEDRDGVYGGTEDLSVAHAVREWCLAAPHDTRIALCGYDGEHNDLETAGWSVVAWKAGGGIGRGADSRGLANRHRERIWFSPACQSAQQLSLMEER